MAIQLVFSVVDLMAREDRVSMRIHGKSKQNPE